jgi:hypothetical protein
VLMKLGLNVEVLGVSGQYEDSSVLYSIRARLYV